MTTAFSNLFRALSVFVRAHKVWATIIALALIWGGYHVYASMTSTTGQTAYVVTTVATGTVVATLSESGQVSASQTLTLSPKASGQVIGVYVKPGAHVYAGQVIAQLDATDAKTALQNAELSLEHQQLSYQQTTATSTLALNLITARNAVTNAQIALDKAHDTSYADIASIYTDLGAITTGLDSALHDMNVTGRPNQENLDAFSDIVSSNDSMILVYKNSAETSYTAAVNAYNTAVAVYKATPRTASSDEILALANTTYTAAQAVADAVKDAHDFFDRVSNDYTLYNYGSSAALSNLLSTTNTYTTTITNDLSSALGVKTSLISAEQSLAQAQNTLQATEGGSNTLTVQSADISLRQAEQTVASAKDTLANYTVVAPFSGTIGSVGVQRYDQAGTGTSVATLVADGMTAKISVSEADAALIKVGQKATLTFDALPDVTIAGTVASIDSVGSTSGGVVSYGAVITFDTQNASVLPGMSVTADIVTGTETGLVVPASAIKVSGNSNYVLVFDPALTDPAALTTGAITTQTPKRVTVTTGLAGDTETIIASGLTAGEQIVTKTSTSAANTTTTSSSGSTRSGSGAQFRALGPGL